MPDEHQYVSRRDHRLSFARENSAYNREWFQQLRERVASGEPYVFVNADIPTEIFKAMDLPVVVNQWWAAVVSAKQKAPEYLGLLNERGYRPNLCQYCSLGFASTLEKDATLAPWGGLPVPSLVVAGSRCGSEQKIFELWADEYDIPFFFLEPAVVADPKSEDWVECARYEWEDIFGKRTIDTLTDQYRELIAFTEKHTGKKFDEVRLSEIMKISNEQEEYYAKTRDLISATSPAPMNVPDHMPATMIPQWHRGSTWARERARLFYEETVDRVAAGRGVVEDERVRLMWHGTGLWYNLDFYEYFQEEFGAVFVWSIYLAIASDAYPTYGDDPLRAVAGRIVKIFNIMDTPPFFAEWIRKEVQRFGIDGVVSLRGGAGAEEGSVCQQKLGTTFFVEQVLEGLGVPICYVGANTVDARTWDDESNRTRVSTFIEREILERP
jgi:benzoyl-CoA reductase/2-hydroxyglutaryl-CoA dehydratase subunit BcrC/BadD/HgdB